MSNTLRAILKENTALLQATAASLMKEGDIEKTIQEYETKDEATKFLDKERQRLIDLATQYDLWNGLLDEYSKIEHEQSDPDSLNAILDKLASPNQARSGSRVGRLETDIRSTLGIPKTKPSAKKGDEDEELVVVGGDSNGTSPTCPLTGSFLEDPVRNKVCGHAYSKHAILSHLRRSTKCPVAGCGNRNVSSADLVPDLALIQLVRRQRRRKDAERERLHLSQALDEVDDDE